MITESQHNEIETSVILLGVAGASFLLGLTIWIA